MSKLSVDELIHEKNALQIKLMREIGTIIGKFIQDTQTIPCLSMAVNADKVWSIGDPTPKIIYNGVTVIVDITL